MDDTYIDSDVGQDGANTFTSFTTSASTEVWTGEMTHGMRGGEKRGTDQCHKCDSTTALY